MHRTDFALMPLFLTERLKYGREMKSHLAAMQIELPNTPLPMLREMVLSEFEDLMASKTWEKYRENDIDSARFELLMKAIGNAANAICKTLANGISALASNR